MSAKYSTIKMSLAAALGILLVGCAAPTLKTASGRPEVTIDGVPIEKIRTELISFFMDRKWVPRSADNMVATFERRADAMTEIFYGTRFEPRAFHRLTMTLLDLGAGKTRLMLTIGVVSNVRSAFEKEQELTGIQLQRELELIKLNLESGKPAGAGIAELHEAMKEEQRQKRLDAAAERKSTLGGGQRTP
jgi:hypothetical protein